MRTARLTALVALAAMPALALVAALLVPSGIALAHDELLSTRPADGAAVATAPTTLTLTFGAALTAPGTVTTRGPGGTRTARAHLDPRDGRRMIGLLATGGPGRYTAHWTATASDGDPIGGTVSFRVRPPSLREVTRTLARDIERMVARIEATIR